MDDHSKREIGKRIKAVRAITGLNQEAFSLLIDTAVPTCSNYELGKRELPLSVAVTINQKMHVSIPWLITGESPMMDEGLNIQTRVKGVKNDN